MSNERKDVRRRVKRDPDEIREDEPSVSQDSPRPDSKARVGVPTIPAENPRIWVLPAANNETFAVADESEFQALAQGLRAAPPALLTAQINKDEKSKVIARTWKAVEARFLEQVHESIFDFAKRMMVSVAWLAIAVAAMRVRGEVEVVAGVLGLLGLGFCGYTIVRYGYRIIRWHNRRVDASLAFSRSVFKTNPLAQRLSAALELRQNLKSDERGKSPDDELLDTNAYRKMIADGTTTKSELIALGKAVETVLVFHDAAGSPRRVSDIAEGAGLDAETVILYRDLAAAANEIRLTADYE